MRQELVGRDEEVAVLAGCLDAALDGRPQLVICRGEAGIGKTRLADELAARAGVHGAVCAWGLAADSEGAPPSWPWRQVLTALAGAVDVVSIARDRALSPDLAPLAPQLFSAGGVAATAEPTPEDRFRQFEAVSRLLRELSRHRPLVVILDDLHWADMSTLLLLRHVARSLSVDPVLLLANTRPTDQRHGELLGKIAREPLTTVLELGGLGEEAIRHQLSALLGDDVDDTTAAHVRSLTGGNPFFVREVGRAMVDARAGRRFSLVTSTVRDAISERLAQLSDDCVRFLRAAAVVGPRFSVPVAAAASEVDAMHGLKLTGEAARAGLVEVQQEPHDFRFVHAIVRDAIEAGLSPPEGVRLHRAAALALERLYGSALGARVFDVAQHWARGVTEGEAAVAAQWLARAGEEAMVQLAYEDAAGMFRQAIELGGAEIADEERCRLLVAAGRAMNLSLDLRGCLDVCREAVELARRLQRPDLAAEAALVPDVGDPRYDATIRRLNQEVLASLDLSWVALRARVMARFVETFAFYPRDDTVVAASKEALALAEQSGDDRALAAALRARQVVCCDPEGLQERRTLAARLLALGLERHDPKMQMAAHLWAVDVQLEAGDLGGVARSIDALAVCAQQVRGPVARFDVGRCRAVLAQAQGRLDDARRLGAETFAILAPTDHPGRFVFLSALTMDIAYHAGPDPDVMAAIEYQGGPENLPELIGFIAQVAYAHALMTAGRLDEAANLYRSLGPVAGWQVPPHVVLCGQVFALEVAAALGQTADVAALHDRLSPYRGHHVVSGMTAVLYFGPVELWLGFAAGHLGRLDGAVVDLREAVRACEANGADGFRVQSQYELAATLARRARPDDVDEARRLLLAAGARAAELGMRPIAAKVAALKAQLEGRGAGEPLTRREREVAALVSEGLTNRDIASRLFIAERTAENHVQHILTKLGLSTRSQVAVWAATEMSTGSK